MDLLHQFPLYWLWHRLCGSLLETQHPSKLSGRKAPAHRLHRNGIVRR